MSKLTIIDKKTLCVGPYQVEVQKQDRAGEEKPHQTVIQAKVKGTTKKETWSYGPEEIANRDEQYAYYDEVKAEKFLGFLKFVTK